MAGPGRPRILRGSPQANELARFLGEVGDQKGLKSATFAAVFPQGPSKSVWAEYLNGSKIIPAKLLGEVLRHLAGDDHRLLERYVTKGKRLWAAAERESRRPGDPRETSAGNIERIYQRLDDAQARMHKAQEIAEGSKQIIGMLIPMGALLQSKIDRLEQEREQSRAIERAETELRLGQARQRLERTESELAKAQHDRYTAEQAQAALAREVLEARREIERLRQRASDLNIDAGETGAAVVLAPPPEPTLEDIDGQLDQITSDRFQREEELAELVEVTGIEPEEPASEPLVISGSVIPPAARQPPEEGLSWTTQDNPVTSSSAPEPQGLLPRPLHPFDADRPYGLDDFMKDLNHLVRTFYGPEGDRMLRTRMALPGNSWDLDDGERFPTLAFTRDVALACGSDEDWEERWAHANSALRSTSRTREHPTGDRPAPTPAGTGPCPAPFVRSEGPWDCLEVAHPEHGRLNLGGLFIRQVEGMELRVEMADEEIVAATVILGDQAVQLQAFAAPGTEGIWDAVRKEIIAGIISAGGTAYEVAGTFGYELHAQVQIELPDGAKGSHVVRFIGVDGPRWFLRGVISGRGAVELQAAADLEALFRSTVVVRGQRPMQPRDPIALTLPDGAELLAGGEPDDK